MKKILGVLGFLVLIFGCSSLAYQDIIIKNVESPNVVGSKPVRVIKVILDGQDFVVNSLATTGGATLQELMDQVGGSTALNGIFFCPASYSYCNEQTYSTFERIFNGKVDEQSRFWPDTGIRAIFGFTKEGEPLLVQNNSSEMEGLWKDTNKEKMDELYFGMSNFPVLLINGENVVKYSNQYLDSKLKGRQNRHFICSTEDGKTIYMGVVGGVNMYETADIIKDIFGCWYGLNLDAGGSANMVYKNTTLQYNGRKIMDAWVVVDREQYIKLIGHTPKEKESYLPEDYYKLTEKEQKKIQDFKTILPILKKKKGKKFIWELIRAARKLISIPKISKNPQKKKFFTEILLALFENTTQR